MDELLILIFGAAGAGLGITTGIVPGWHPNNLAILLGLLSTQIAGLLSGVVNADLIPVLVAALILGAALSHTFLNIIPAVYLGSPEDETALSLLPGHALLLQGRGYHAIALSAAGSIGAILSCGIMLLPYKLLLSDPVHGYAAIIPYIPHLLIIISAILILSEHSGLRGYAIAFLVYLLSGMLGIIGFKLDLESPIGFGASFLMPALCGLFGISTLIYSCMHSPKLPPQLISNPRIQLSPSLNSVLLGSIFGSLMGFLPGLTAAQATILAMLARRRQDPEQTIVTLSATNTACCFYTLIALFSIGRPRSGVMIVLDQLVQPQLWTGLAPPKLLCQLLMVILIASLVGYFATLHLGKLMARMISRIPYRQLCCGITGFLILICYLFTGWVGLGVLGLATMIGLIPILHGVRRSHGMGVVLLPVILWRLGIS